MAKEPPEPQTHVVTETENYMVWSAEEPDGEITYHIELNSVTLHFFTEEWKEFLELVRSIS